MDWLHFDAQYGNSGKTQKMTSKVVNTRNRILLLTVDSVKKDTGSKKKQQIK